MKTSGKIALLITVPIVFGSIGFGVMVKRADYDEIAHNYNYNTGYYKDQTAIGKEFIQEGAGGAPSVSSGTQPFNTPLPDDLSVESLTNWVTSLNISQTRKDLIINSLRMTGQARYECVSEAHGHFKEPSIVGKTIECSGFVNWGLHKVGLSNSDLGLVADLTDNKSGKFKQISDDELYPGDYKAYKEGGVTYTGHVGMYLGRTKDGRQIFLDAGSPSGSATPKIREHHKLASGYGLRYIPLEEMDKAAIDTGVATKTPEGQVTVTGGNLSPSTPVPDNFQDANVITSYINSLNISSKRKAVVLELYKYQGKWNYEYNGAGRSLDPKVEPPDGLHIDCSGTVSWVYRRILNAQGFNGYYTGKSPELMSEVAQPLPGDTVWKSGHVEIYVGRLADGRVVTIGSGDGKVPKAKIHPGLQDGKPRKFYRPRELQE
jgi:hypothetical protein